VCFVHADIISECIRVTGIDAFECKTCIEIQDRHVVLLESVGIESDYVLEREEGRFLARFSFSSMVGGFDEHVSRRVSKFANPSVSCGQCKAFRVAQVFRPLIYFQCRGGDGNKTFFP
jgi:hypothetical protein